VNHRSNVDAASLNHFNGGGMMLDDHILLFHHSFVSTNNMGHQFLGLHIPFELSLATHQTSTQQHHETTTTTTRSYEKESVRCICLAELPNGT